MGQTKVALSLAHHDAPPHITVLIDPYCLDCRCGSPGLEPVPPRPYERAETNPDNVALENRVVILDSFDNTIGCKQMVRHILTTQSDASIFAVS